MIIKAADWAIVRDALPDELTQEQLDEISKRNSPSVNSDGAFNADSK